MPEPAGPAKACLPLDEGWTYFETVEVPPGSSALAARATFRASHPELADAVELRVDLMCGRDGRARLRFSALARSTGDPPDDPAD